MPGALFWSEATLGDSLGKSDNVFFLLEVAGEDRVNDDRHSGPAKWKRVDERADEFLVIPAVAKREHESVDRWREDLVLVFAFVEKGDGAFPEAALEEEEGEMEWHSG